MTEALRVAPPGSALDPRRRVDGDELGYEDRIQHQWADPIVVEVENADLPTVISAELGRPRWHALAACCADGPSEWTIGNHEDLRRKLARLRSICVGCPTSGPCLREALAEKLYEGAIGPVRVGWSWARLGVIVDDLDPTTDADWSDLAAWLLDGVLVIQSDFTLALVVDTAA